MYRLLLIVFLLFSTFAYGQTDSLMAAGPGACNYIKEISISGDRKTKDAIILRELSVHTGDCIQDENLAAVLELNKLRLYNLRLFTDVKIAWAPVAEDTVRMEIIVLDRFPIMPGGNLEFADRNFNVWWTEQNRDLRRINLGLSINHNNFRGNRETITASVQVGVYPKAGAVLQPPFFADKNQKHGYGASIFALQNREIAYITDNNKLKFLRAKITTCNAGWTSQPGIPTGLLMRPPTRSSFLSITIGSAIPYGS